MTRALRFALSVSLWTPGIVSTDAGSAPRPAAVLAQPAQGGPAVEPISINNNRAFAGTLVGKVLTVHLEARVGEWHPEGDNDPGIVVKAFAVEGGPLQVPGPLIRVPEGTEVRASVRNRTDERLVLHGFYTRPAHSSDARTTVIVAPGDVQEVPFNAGSAGTYFYWAGSSADGQMVRENGRDSQLAGAFVIDPPGASVPDRVFVFTSWRDVRVVDGQEVTVSRFLINGKSWPDTERLTYDVGDTVHFRLVNAGISVHPMRLHGFYYNVDSRGNEAVDTIFPAGSSHLVNTERLPTGQTFSLTWRPTRPGTGCFIVMTRCTSSERVISTADS